MWEPDSKFKLPAAQEQTEARSLETMETKRKEGAEEKRKNKRGRRHTASSKMSSEKRDERYER